MSDDGEANDRTLGKLKRWAMYLVNYPRLTVNFEDTGTVSSEVRVYSDSDWAVCLRTCRSTSGGCVTLNGTAIKTWEHHAAHDRIVVR